MLTLTPEEYRALQYLLSKVENRHEIMAVLVDVIMLKYKSKKEAARALGYSQKTLRQICRGYVYETLH